MAESKGVKTLAQLEKEAHPIKFMPHDPSNRFLSKKEFMKKMERMKAREAAMAKAAREFDEGQNEQVTKKTFVVMKGKRQLKTFTDKDEATGYIADSKNPESLSIVEQ